MALNGYYDVTAYGADPSGGSPANTAIQMAVFACTSAMQPGGVIWFPNGSYYIAADTSPIITLASGVELRGAGSGSTTLQTHSTGTAQTIVPANNANAIAIRDLGFSGNGSHGTTSTPPTVQVTNGTDVKILDCDFSGNAGESVNLSSVTNAEVADCNFSGVGYSGYRTDAITVASTSSSVQIHDNVFDTCSYGAVYVQGNACDVSHNTFTTTSGNAIYFSGSDTRVGLNSIDTVNFALQSVVPIAIQADGASRFCIVGNIVSNCEGEGISVTSGWSDGIIAANNVRNNGFYAGGTSNIKIAGATTKSNQGLALVANNAYSDAVNTIYGIRFDTSAGALAQNTAIMGNNAYGNLTQGMFDGDNLLISDSNTVIGNFPWVERMHTTQPASTSGTAMTQLVSMTIPAGSIRQTSGIRITASGTTMGATQKNINLGFGATTNILNGLSWTPGNPDWQLFCVITNNDSVSNINHQQVALVLFWEGGVLKKAKEQLITGIYTTASQNVTFQAQSTISGSVTVKFFTIERC